MLMNGNQQRTSLGLKLSPILLFLLLAPFVLYPLLGLFRLSLEGSVGHPFASYASVWGQPAFWASVGTTMRIALVSTGIAAVVGISMAVLLRYAPFPGASLVLRSMELMVAFPSFLIAFSLIFLYGDQGAITILVEHVLGLSSSNFGFVYSSAGIVFAEVTYYLPFIIRPTLSILSLLDDALSEAAGSLGSSPLRVIRRVVLPIAMPGIAAGVVLCLLFICNEFGILLVLGTQATPTIPLAIYDLAMENLDLKTASAYAVTMLLFVICIYALYRWLQSRIVNVAASTLQSVRVEVARKTIHSPVLRVFGWIASALCLLVFFGPLVTVFLSSVATNWVGTVLPSAYTLHWFQGLTADDWISVGRSLVIGITVGMLAIILGLWAALLQKRGGAWARVLDTAMMIPLAVPSVVIGLAVLLAFHSRPFNLSTSPMIVILAQTVLTMPIAYQTLQAAVTKMPNTYGEAAAGLGARPWRVFWRVTVPLLLPACKTAFALVFTLSAGELGATMMVYPPGFSTAPIHAAQYVERGFYGQASAVAVVMFAATFMCLLLVSSVGSGLRLRRRPSRLLSTAQRVVTK